MAATNVRPDLSAKSSEPRAGWCSSPGMAGPTARAAKEAKLAVPWSSKPIAPATETAGKDVVAVVAPAVPATNRDSATKRTTSGRMRLAFMAYSS